jgi:hypothetical protein
LNTTKENGSMQILCWALGKFPGQNKQDDRHHSSSEPEPLQATVDAAFAKDTLGTYDSPNDTVSEENTPVGTRVFVFLPFVADIVDISKGPEELQSNLAHILKRRAERRND